MSDLWDSLFSEAEHLGFDFESGARFMLDAFESTEIGSGVLENGILRLHTGGWSDCEALIEHAEKSMWWIRWWYSSTRGGHYVFGDVWKE